MSADALFLHFVNSDAPEASAAAAVLEWVEAVQQVAPGAVTASPACASTCLVRV